MKARISIELAVAALALLTGCVAQKTQPQASDLLGTWKTGTVKTEWGPAVHEVTFLSASDIEFKMTLVETQESHVSKAKYRLSGKQLISEALNKGQPVSVWLEDSQLVIQAPSEPPQRFTRK